jgi:RND family efflux transporter MFP subunit
LLALILCAVALLTGCRDKGDAQKESSQSAAAKRSVTDEAEPGVTLNRAAQERAALKVEPLAVHAVEPALTAFGRLEEDTAASFLVRAQIAGTLHAMPDHDWPSLGRKLSAGSVFGQLEPRLLPSDRLSITTQLATARSDLSSSAASLAAAQSAYERAKALNADNKNVSDKAVQEAAARLASEQAKERAARANINSLEASLQPSGATGYRPLVADRSGDIAEVVAQPGEAIEQGAPIVRLTRFDHLLVRVDLPVGEHLSADNRGALITPAGFEDQTPLPGERVSVAAATDPQTQGISLLYRLRKTLFGLRPGTAVTARLLVAGVLKQGVLIPRAAVVQQGGNSWAYVQISGERFARRPVPQDSPVEAGFVVTTGFSPEERVVIVGAPTLLSEEFKSQNQADAE